MMTTVIRPFCYLVNQKEIETAEKDCSLLSASALGIWIASTCVRGLDDLFLSMTLMRNN